MAPDEDAAPSATTSAASRERPPAGEAIRTTVARFDRDPLLAPHAERLKAHFGDAKGPFLVQHVALAGGRTMVLVSLADETKPFVLTVDDGHVAWTRERPTAGILPPVEHLAIAPHPDGGAVMFAFVPSVYVVAARVWSEDGGPFADLEVLGMDVCDALSAAYAPGAGWLVVASRRGGARAQLVREDGSVAWPREGLEVGAPWRAGAPVTIVVDTPGSAVLFQYATRAGADHVLASAYDFTGQALWHAPVDVGAVPLVATGQERLDASLQPGGAVRVELPHGTQSRTARAAELDGQGGVRWMSR